MMDFSRVQREKSIIAPSVKKYRVYTPIGGEKEELYTGREKKFTVLGICYLYCMV